jgi:predicted short-subunit dehydrogenase-like oxidoreductase (DUF2520 family)
MKITLIGSGNVSTHLGIALFNKGYEIVQVYSKSINNAKSLAEKISAKYCNNTSEIFNNSDLYIVSLKDDVVEDVLKTIDFNNKLVVHTSGSLNVDVLKEASINYGVFYPFQTFSKNVKLDFYNDVPICIEANTNENNENLLLLAEKISKQVDQLDSEKRRILHLSGVFACNFSNYMFSIAENLLGENNISFELIRPLIKETVRKVINNNPSEVQTGPAVRGDVEILNNHTQLLNDNLSYKKIYQCISDEIISQNK